MEKTGLIKYDAMMAAIAVCCEIDEIKDLRDKVYALQLYAQQAKNYEAETRAAEIRIRAERKTGQLLTNEEMAKGGGDATKPKEHRSYDTTTAKTLDEIGISKDQSSRWQKLADVSDKKFEAYLADADKPSTAGAIKLAPIQPKKRKKVKRPDTSARSNGKAFERPAESEDEHTDRLELSQACYALGRAGISYEELIERMPPQAVKRFIDAADRAKRWFP